MKKILLVLCLILISKLSYAQLDTKYDYSEVVSSANKKMIDTIIIHKFTKSIEITYRKGYLDGENFVSLGNAGNKIIINSEYSNDFDDFIHSVIDETELQTYID